MVKNKLLFACILIFLFGTTIRFHEFLARTPFDWDQNRDYQKVEAIAGGKITLLGPIAKGDSGFYLGPLYYYLLLPGYVLSNGNPISFPITSIIIDLAALALLISLSLRRHGKERAVLISAAFIWSVSWFAIENSRVSWNVSLLPLWVVVMYTILTIKLFGIKNLLFAGFIAGLSFHIHASLIPFGLLSVFLLIVKNFSPAKLAYLIVGYILALSPLIFFDLRHAFFNSRLMVNFASIQSSISKPDLLPVFVDVVEKLGRNTLGLFTGTLKMDFSAGIFVLIVSIVFLIKGSYKPRLLALTIILNTLLAIILRDLRFPEYYLAISYLPTVSLLILFILSISKKYSLWALFILLIFAVYQNVSHYNFDVSPYSLQNKIELVKSISELNEKIDVRYELSPGREGGLVPLLNKYKVEVGEEASLKLVITDKLDSPVVIGDELATSYSQFGGLKAAVYRLQ